MDLSKFDFADPRQGSARIINVGKKRSISNLEKQVVFFSCDSYRVYTKAECVSQIVMAAYSCLGSTPLLLGIEPAPSGALKPPALWQTLHGAGRSQRYWIDVPRSVDLCRTFDDWANSERWCYAAPEVPLPKERARSLNSLQFDSLLLTAEHWSFAITVDLDGILYGFARATTEFDDFRARLVEL